MAAATALGHGVPATLFEMLRTPGERAKYQIIIGYSAERLLEEGQYAPLVHRRTRKSIIVMDKALLGRIWVGVEPRTSRILERQYYYDGHTKVAYRFSDGVAEQRSIRAQSFFSENDFATETAGGHFPFAWARGTVDHTGLMSRDDFHKLVDGLTKNEKTTLAAAS